MEDFSKFDNQMSKNTKLLLLLAFILVLYSFLGANTDVSIFTGAIIALVIVAGVDYFQVFAQNHPVLWSRVKFIIIALIILFTILAWMGV